MQGHRGKTWLAAVILAVSLIWLPALGMATEVFPAVSHPFVNIGAQTPMEAQMLGEKPFQAQPPSGPALLHNSPLNYGGQGIRLLLPRNLESRISVHYNPPEPAPLMPRRRHRVPLLLQSSLDYRLLPNLRVGLNSYLYRPEMEDFAVKHPLDNPVLGVGPALRYDLGRWSFVVKSQMESGNRDQGPGMQNWFRIWYAF